MTRFPSMPSNAKYSETHPSYDPLGWVAPILINIKIFIQDLWIEGLDWDESLNQNLHATWKEIRGNLNGLEGIIIPKWLGGGLNTVQSLNGFADASKRANNACIHIVPDVGPPRLIHANSRVAPSNTISVPKLEFLAAQLLARLIDYILPTFIIQLAGIHCWNDLKNVLCLLKPFEANVTARTLG